MGESIASMSGMRTPRWDYVILTASNQAQAAAYELQMRLRKGQKSLSEARNIMVVADPEGRRVGSGGSTLFCLMEVVNRELQQRGLGTVEWGRVRAILQELRILIIHAGGDSRRLPAYGPCGKIFIPVPGYSADGWTATLFDRLLPGFVNLPDGIEGMGQVVITAGDALILFDATNVSFSYPGLTALASSDSPAQASKHGVFCPDGQGKVRLYLQKPGLQQQKDKGALDERGRALLDIGIMSFDASMAIALMEAFGVALGSGHQLVWHSKEVMNCGLDFFREVCCAMGTEVTASHYKQQVKQAGSTWPEETLERIFSRISPVPFHLQVTPQSRFLHFGTTRQLISSGAALRHHDEPGKHSPEEVICLGNTVSGGGRIMGSSSWVEGCRIESLLELGGDNVVVGAEISETLVMSKGACLDVLPGKDREGRGVWFARCYGIGDTFKDSVKDGATFCGRPLLEWFVCGGHSVGRGLGFRDSCG